MTFWRHWIVGQLDASIVAAALLCVAVLLRHRLSPRVRSFILLIALVRLALPPWLRSPWSEALVDVPPVDGGRAWIAMALQSDGATYLAAITTAVTLLLLLRVAWVFMTAERRWLQATTPAPFPSINGVELRLSAAGEGPLAAGLRRKLIVLPESALQLDPVALDAVIAHELAHHARKDLWWIALGEVLKSIAWFNPLSHLITRALVASREDGSDDWAISKTSNDPVTYAQALLQSARLVASPQPLGTALLGQGYGGQASAHPMGNRLRRLLDSSATREGRLGVFAILVIVICGAAAIPGAHMPSVSDDDADERIVIVIEEVLRA
jgi:beta-lactamase regulating signal transducer with metallopeptidase domain